MKQVTDTRPAALARALAIAEERCRALHFSLSSGVAPTYQKHLKHKRDKDEVITLFGHVVEVAVRVAGQKTWVHAMPVHAAPRFA